MWKRLVLPLLLLLSAGPVLAQETTPEAPAGLPQRVVLGGLVVYLPEGWSAIPGQGGETVIANIDLYTLDPNTAFPPETVLLQVSVYSTAQLPPSPDGITSSRQILESIPAEGEQPPVTEIEEGSVTIARIEGENSQSGGDSVAYALLLDEQTFVFGIGASLNTGTLATYEPELYRVLAALEVDLSVPLAADTLTRYNDIPQSRSAEGFPRLGNPDAPVVITEISSFACGACRTFHDLALPVLLEYIRSGEVLFIYQPFVGTGNLPNNERATRAALCAAEQDAFWQFSDGLFAWHDFGGVAFLDARLTAGAAALSLDMTAFAECLASDRTNAIIEAAVMGANRIADFVGTPTVLLNGSSIEWDPAGLTALIEAALTAEATPEATAAP